jgi:CRISPR-associated protein Csx3
MELFPAVMIGGPPHSGKSVLAYSLSQALRAHQVAHYVLRAFPDGEGDWANEADQALVRRVRVKGDATPDWVARMCRDIANRHLPLIVDVGGRPKAWQETVFDHCTHAILLTPDEQARSAWRELAARHTLPVLADLHSRLGGGDVLQATGPILRGQISGLERGRSARGPVFEALVSRLATLFDYDAAELRATHLSLAPAELVVELSRVGRALGLGQAWQRWLPEHLPQLLDYLPAGTPLAIYDRGPNWLYAALAVHAYPQPIYQFDVRLGWVAPPTLTVDATRASPSAQGGGPLRTGLVQRPTHVRMELTLTQDYLDYGEAEELALPHLPTQTGLILSGKLPMWMWTALPSAYIQARWLAVFQPQLGDRAVVVASREEQVSIGDVVISQA